MVKRSRNAGFNLSEGPYHVTRLPMHTVNFQKTCYAKVSQLILPRIPVEMEHFSLLRLLVQELNWGILWKMLTSQNDHGPESQETGALVLILHKLL